MRMAGFRQYSKALFSFALAVCLLLGTCLTAAGAKEKRTVRVAFFPMEGYHEKLSDGRYAGMDAEYLDSLCGYANWQIRFVECGSWDEALRLLSARKVDLVGTAQYSPERAENFQYADLSSGYTFGIIAAGSDSPLAYEDFQAMENITFGMVKTYVRRDEFLQYMQDNGVSAPRIREYDSTRDLQQALDSGEIDAMVHTFMEIRDGQRLVGRFAPRPFYYISYPDNDAVMRELNYAIADLKMNEPELESRLMNEFFQSRLDKTIVFTTGEKEYIREAGPITAGYFAGYYPFVYEEDGECMGLTREMLEYAVGLTGMTVQWKKIDSPGDANQALLNGEIDVMTYCTHSEDESSENQLTKLKEYTHIPLVLVMDKKKETSEIRTLASVGYLSEEARQVAEVDQDTSLLFYESQRECLEAVKSGKADAALCDGYLAEYQLSTVMRYYNLEIRLVLNQEHSVTMTVRSEDEALAGVLNKTMLTVDTRAISDYMLERNVRSVTNLSQFIEDNSVVIIILLLLLLAGVVAVAASIIRDSRKIQKLMYKDVEIDIWNLNYLIYAGEKSLDSERARKHTYAIAYLNISQFQRYKVVYGWTNGQRLLVSIADILSRCVQGEGEICAKADGDHFVLLLSSEYGDIVERMRNIGSLIEEYIFQNTGSRIELQAGIRIVPPDNIDLREAIVCSDQAIDFIRHGGGEKIRIFDQVLEQMVKERHEQQALLDSISIEGNFATYYQAKVDVRTERIVGAEALVRMLDPLVPGAVRSPGFFVPYYEQTGRVTEIDFFVLECVCRMLRRRLEQGEEVVTISCNFSRIHFTKPDFVNRLMGVIEGAGIPRELIEVEVTETIVMEELQQKLAEQTMQELHARGIRLSIDDFGSGYSSLGVIEKIPASVIKLDRSFLLNQEDRRRQVKIMKRIVDLAEDLNAQIVCEGVETEADVELMREIGANVAQGYRYARPVPEHEFEARLSANRR